MDRYSLHDYASRGEVEEVRRLIQDGQSMNAKDETGWTPLHRCAYKGHKEVVELLLAYGALTNRRNEDGCTALFLSAELGHIDIVYYLLGANAKVEITDVNGDTALHISARKGHTHIAQLLVKRGASTNAKNNNKQTPLHKASKGNHVNIIKYLKISGGEINARDTEGNTALHFSALKNHHQSVKLLLELGASVNAVNNDGFSPLHLCAIRGHKDAAEILIRHRANLELRCKWGKTSLVWAKFCDRQDLVTIFEAQAELRRSARNYVDNLQAEPPIEASSGTSAGTEHRSLSQTARSPSLEDSLGSLSSSESTLIATEEYSPLTLPHNSGIQNEDIRQVHGPPVFISHIHYHGPVHFNVRNAHTVAVRSTLNYGNLPDGSADHENDEETEEEEDAEEEQNNGFDGSQNCRR